MFDFLYQYMGGKKLYSKEEWDALTQKNYDVVEYDAELCEITKTFETEKSYSRCVDALTRVGIKDFDFVIELRDHDTQHVLARKSFCPGSDGKISVFRI